MTLILNMDSIIDKFYKELRFEHVSEIINEERVLKEFKNFYIKHAFDSMGSGFRKIYNTQYKFVQKLKIEYKDRYGT